MQGSLFLDPALHDIIQPSFLLCKVPAASLATSRARVGDGWRRMKGTIPHVHSAIPVTLMPANKRCAQSCCLGRKVLAASLERARNTKLSSSRIAEGAWGVLGGIALRGALQIGLRACTTASHCSNINCGHTSLVCFVSDLGSSQAQR